MKMKKIKKFGVYQTAKVSGIMCFLVPAVFMIPIGLFILIIGGDDILAGTFSNGLALIFLPFVYGIVGFIVTTIGCLIYNRTTKWIGGIEFEVETMG